MATTTTKKPRHQRHKRLPKGERGGIELLLIQNVDGSFGSTFDSQNEFSEPSLFHQMNVLLREVIKTKVAIEDDFFIEFSVDHFVAKAGEPVPCGQGPGVIEDFPNTPLVDHKFHFVHEAFGALGSEFWICDCPRAECTFAIGAVTPSHGPHEGESFFPLLKIEIGVC